VGKCTKGNVGEFTFLDLLVEGLKVSDAAQTTAALGMLYRFWDKTSITVDYNYFADLYSRINILDRADFDPSTPAVRKGDPYKVPNYSTFDTSLRHGFNFGEFDTTVTVRVNNVFDTEYIADAFDAADPLVWFGFGRTFSLDVKIKF